MGPFGLFTCVADAGSDRAGHPVGMTRPRLFASALILAAGAAVLTGCGGNDPAPAAAPATTHATLPSATPPLAGTAAFQADLQRVGFGTKDTSDPRFLDIGQQACTAFRGGITFGEQVAVYAKASNAVQGENLVRSAVRNLCPEYASRLP